MTTPDRALVETTYDANLLATSSQANRIAVARGGVVLPMVTDVQEARVFLYATDAIDEADRLNVWAMDADTFAKDEPGAGWYVVGIYQRRGGLPSYRLGFASPIPAHTAPIYGDGPSKPATNKGPIPLWSGKGAPPAIGSEIVCNDRVGTRVKVTGYSEQSGWLMVDGERLSDGVTGNLAGAEILFKGA